MQQKSEIELHTPVALIIFNRPDATEAVFKEIARARPKKLFVIADGPRPDHPGDVGQCAAARAIIDRVDWNCEVLKNYSEVNMGCGQRPATGISWVFEQVEEAIIIEDDCVPHPTFFRFCEELLEKYRHDERVMTVVGRNNQAGRMRQTPGSYHFRRTFACWGWATWRRAWQHYDFKIAIWRELKNTSWLMDVLGDQRSVDYWQKIFDQAYASGGNFHAWDFQWLFACWVQNSMAAVAGTNLIQNIGFGTDATHTKSANDSRKNRLFSEMLFPLIHPPHMAISKEAELLIIDDLCKYNFRLQRGWKLRMKQAYQKYLRGNLGGLKRFLAS